MQSRRKGYSPTTRAPDDVDNIRILLLQRNKIAEQWVPLWTNYIPRDIWIFSVLTQPSNASVYTKKIQVSIVEGVDRSTDRRIW